MPLKNKQQPLLATDEAVIPAKAGIQLKNKFPRKWDNTLGFVCFAEHFFRWIPAFAGMTA